MEPSNNLQFNLLNWPREEKVHLKPGEPSGQTGGTRLDKVGTEPIKGKYSKYNKLKIYLKNTHIDFIFSTHQSVKLKLEGSILILCWSHKKMTALLQMKPC